MNLPFEITHESIQKIINEYESFELKEEALSDQFYNLSQYKLSKLEEYKKIVNELQILTENYNISNYKSLFPDTLIEKRSKITNFITTYDKTEKLALNLYTDIHSLCIRLIFQIKKFFGFALKEKLKILNEKLENLLSNNQKFTSPLRLRSSLKPFFNTKLSFLSLDLTEKFLSFYPNEKTSAKIFCEAIKSVIAK